jgi:hypothetical protein
MDPRTCCYIVKEDPCIFVLFQSINPAKAVIKSSDEHQSNRGSSKRVPRLTINPSRNVLVLFSPGVLIEPPVLRWYFHPEIRTEEISKLPKMRGVGASSKTCSSHKMVNRSRCGNIMVMHLLLNLG